MRFTEKFPLIAAGLVAATLCSSPVAFAEEKAAPVFIGCGVTQGVSGVERNCSLLYRTQKSVDFGVLATSGNVDHDTAKAILVTLSLRPLEGSYWVSMGAGVSRTRLSFIKETHTGFAAEVRMGNRWTLPFGLTLGLSYIGLQFLGHDYRSLLTFGPEIGWRF